MTKFTVNNQPVAYQIDPDTPLLWALRDASNLTGTKYGCGQGLCGACTVHLNGQAVRRAIKTGATNQQGVRVEEGLIGGEEVIINPPAELKDGGKVKIK